MMHVRSVVCGGWLVSLVVLTGCVMSPMTPDPVEMTASLRGSNEVPPTLSNASGSLQASLNRQTNQLSWTITYSGLSGPVTAAHFHGPAVAGQNAGVAVPILGDSSSPMQGAAMLTANQATELLAEKWYVNVHTAANPGGEIRGQVLLGH